MGDHQAVQLSRPSVIVINKSTHPTWEVRSLVERCFRGDRHHPPTIIVHNRPNPNDDREGFTPFDRSQPVDIWLQPSRYYPQPGAKTWVEELALSATHESYHWNHPGQACPKGICEKWAEAYAHEHYRMLKRRQRYSPHRPGVVILP